MKLLLDTHTFLWLIIDDPKLSTNVKSIFLDSDNDIYLSMSSVWEMAIKVSLGKLILSEPFEKIIPREIKTNGIYLLNIEFTHIAIIANLPFFHRDPFDRIIIAQSMVENFPVLSIDTHFDRYKIKRIW